MSLTEKIISKIIQNYLRENVSNSIIVNAYLGKISDALAQELVSKGATLNEIDMKYFLDDKEVTAAELAQAADDLQSSEGHSESVISTLLTTVQGRVTMGNKQCQSFVWHDRYNDPPQITGRRYLVAIETIFGDYNYGIETYCEKDWKHHKNYFFSQDLHIRAWADIPEYSDNKG